MAKAMLTGVTKALMVEVNGSHRPHGSANDPIFLLVDGVQISVPLPIPDGSHHVAGYLATFQALAGAHQLGVTDLTVATPANLLRNQVTGVWRTKEPALAMLRDCIRTAVTWFDTVAWV